MSGDYLARIRHLLFRISDVQDLLSCLEYIKQLRRSVFRMNHQMIKYLLLKQVKIFRI